MLAGKKLSDFTCLFSPDDYERNDSRILSYFKIWMKLIKQTWLIKQNFDQIKSGRLKTILSKKLTKEHHAVNYIDEILIVLSATCGGVCIISSASVVGPQLE